MADVCPTITAGDVDQYKTQLELVGPFVERLHIDLMDGQLAPSKSPKLTDIWWPDNVVADIHLMYQRPMESIDELIRLRPHMVIIHSEASVDHLQFQAKLKEQGIKCGLALLQQTAVDSARGLIPAFDQVLVFSGHLGYHGGTADLGLLTKVEQIKKYNPSAEIAWDGGINDQNTPALIAGGVTVLNVGGYLHTSPDPKQAYAKLKELANA